MQTQTGGTGETVQLQTQPTPSAENFDVKINPPVDSEPPAQPTQPTEPVKPVATVPTQQEAQQQAILPTAPVEETVPVQPTDDLDAIFNDDEIVKPKPLSIPNQQPSPETPKMGEVTEVDTSFVKPLNIVEDEDLPETKVEPEKPIDIPVPLVEDPNNPGVLIQATTPKQTSTEYKGKPVTVTNQGHVVKNPEVKKAEAKGDGFYKYGDNIYQKKGDQWYKDVTGQGGFKLIEKDAEERTKELNTNARTLNYNQGGDYYVYDKHLYQKKGNAWYKEVKGDFVKLKEGNVAQRQAELNRNAIPYRPGGKSYAVNMAENVITPKYGRIGDFNSYNLLTSGGDKTVASGMSFSSLTAPKIAGKDRMYNDDGTYNFNYDANYAKAAPETRAVIDAANKPAPKASLPTVKLVTGLDLNAVKNSAEELKGPQYQQAFDNAANFAGKDLMTMFAENNKLSKDQFTQLVRYQDQVKKIVGDGTYTADKAKALAGVMANTENFFNQAKDVNTFVNEAYSKDMSLGKYALDQKKQDYMEQLNLRDNADFQDAARESFESTVAIADFIQENIDSGKMMYDRVNGGYKFSNNISETEKRYIENQLSKMTSDYNKLEQENYASVRGEISEFKGELSGINAQINSLKKQAQGLSSDDPRLKEINGQLFGLNKQKQLLEKKIDNKESLLSTVFKTEPQKFAKETAKNITETSQTILSAIPKEFSPKERFDFFYRQLSNANDGLAKANQIDEDYLTRLSRRFKDMLDWGGYFSLSEAEKEYLHNKAMLNQLAPLYYNNDFGITKSSGDFFESFMNGFSKALLPNTSASDGYFAQSEAANTMKSFLEEKGFTEEDMLDEDALKELENATRVDFLSRENWGNMVGTTAGIIAPLIVTELVPGSAVKVGNAVEKLVAGTNNVQKAAQYVNRATDAFDAAMSTTKLGRFLLPAVKEGAKFEATGTLFGSTEDEMYFMSGLIGGAASNAFTKVLAKMTPPQAAKYIESMFGPSANMAMKAIKKGGEASVRGVVETVEEASQELTNIYTDELRSRGFFDEVQSRFGTLDEVQKFLVSSFVMGAGFGLVSGSTADDAYESLSDEKKKQVNDVINAVKADYNYAENKTEDYVEAQERQNKRQENVEKDPEIKQEVTETGDIEFDVEGIERTAEGKPSSVEVEESTFTEPVELFNTEGNDQENQQGVPSKVGEGEKPVEEQPVTKPSEEAPSPSGVVQGEQGQAQEKITVTPTEGYKFSYASEEEIPSELKGVEPISRSETQVGRGRNAKKSINLTFSGQQLMDAGLAQEASTKQVTEREKGRRPRTTKIAGAKEQEVESYSSLEKKNNEASNIENEIEKQIEEHYRSKGVPQNIIDELILFGNKSVTEFAETMPDVANAYDESIEDLHKKLDEAANNRKTIEEKQQSKIIDDVIKSFEDFGVKGIGLKSVTNFFNSLLNNSGFDSFAKKLRFNDFEDLKKDLVFKTYDAIAPDEFRGVDKYTDIPENIRTNIEKTVDNAMQRFKERLVSEETSVTEPSGKTRELPTTELVGKTEELPAAETTGNPFEEISEANKLKGTAKTTAIKDLKQKYGADYNRISKIDTNFASIVKTLEKNNLINKDCG